VLEYIQLIAIEKRASECRLDVFDNLFLSTGVSTCIPSIGGYPTSNSSVVLKPDADCCKDQLCSPLPVAETYEFAPCFSHMLWDAALDRLDLARAQTGNCLQSASCVLQDRKFVPVLLCLGLEKPGPTGPCRVLTGACVLSVRSRGALSTAAAAMVGKCGGM
jgi:hypothetical protein